MNHFHYRDCSSKSCSPSHFGFWFLQPSGPPGPECIFWYSLSLCPPISSVYWHYRNCPTVAMFMQHLSDRQQFVNIKISLCHFFLWSASRFCSWSTSVLIYMLPLGQIIWRHGLNFHIYADTQIYFTAQFCFPPPSSTWFYIILKYRWLQIS